MGVPATKRRKVEHISSDDDDDASFASFGDSDAEGGAQEEAIQETAVEDGIDGTSGSSDEDMDDGEDDDSEASGDEDGTVTKATQAKVNRERNTQQKDRLSVGKHGSNPMSSAYTAGTFKSNVFKLQVDELLDQIRPRRGKREENAEKALHELKKTIEQTAARGPHSVEEAERQLVTNSKVAVPFPDPRPPKDAKYKLEFAKPAGINVVGSYALKTATRASDTLAIDMMVQMPSSLFQEKDYLNHRYFYKRAYYLACIASTVQNAHASAYQFRFEDSHGDALKPILVVVPTQKTDNKADAKPAPKWRINIIPCVDVKAFAEEKLLPGKNCVRPAEGVEPEPTPFYNSSLRADMLVPSYLKLLHSAATSSEAFKDACLLGSTWLRQRGFGGSISAGGFGTFEWAGLMAVLLQGGGPNGRAILSGGYSSYQLFKATLQLLAVKDMSKQALIVGSDDVKVIGDGSPMVWDAARSHNLLYKVTPWSYNHLRQEARTALTMLGDQSFDGFEAAFILRTDNALLRYDYTVEIPAAKLPSSNGSIMNSCRTFYNTLKRGLGDRVTLVTVHPPPTSPWQLGSARSTLASTEVLRIGLVVNPDTISRTVDHGPPAESKTEAAAFRKFWGEKAELRRFRDGSIQESLVWSVEAGQSVLEQIVRYLTQRHIGESANAVLLFSGSGFQNFLRQSNAITAFQPMMDAFKQMERDISGLDDLPLSVRQIMPADSQLRYSSIQEPLPAVRKQRPTPATVTIQFEGSTRWPDDLAAIQRTKIAFLLDLSKRLQESVGSVTMRVGLESQEHDIRNQAFLDIIYDSGAAFRMRIHHDREQTLLERQLKDKSLAPFAKEAAATALAAYKRDYIKTPAHTQAIARLSSRYPALSGAIRLTKKWFASHLLSNHIADEVIELVVARTFLQPWPWQAPSSIHTGFLRTLHWLSRWDWRAEPLIVDLSGEFKPAEARSRFEAWRKLDPSMNRIVLFAASSADVEGTTWTDGHPARVVAGRMTALAKAACTEIEEQKLQIDPSSLFASPLADFDFVLHLDPSAIGSIKKRKSSGLTFKNVELASLTDSSLIGYDPAKLFLEELQEVYGAAIVFFSGGHERPVIAGLFSPQTAPRSWKVNLAYSTVPKKEKGGEVMAEINKDGILGEIARLGGDMIAKVERNR